MTTSQEKLNLFKINQNNVAFYIRT